MLIPSLMAALAFLPQSPGADFEGGYWNGPDWIGLEVDGSRLALRFEPGLDETAARGQMAAMPGLAEGQAEAAAWIPGATVYLTAAEGLGGDEAWDLCRQLASRG